MGSALRVRLVGDDPELDRVEAAIQASQISPRRFHDLDEACELQKEEPAEVFVLGPSLYYQSHLNQIQKLTNRPEVVLASGPRPPNLAKILIPHLLYADWSNDEMLWELQSAGDIYRRTRRLEALRDHHQRNWNTESNPAINLVTSLMRKCTVAEEFRDLLASVTALRSVIDFHDASLLVLDHEENLLEAWHSSVEAKDRLSTLPPSKLGVGRPWASSGEESVFSFTSSENPAWDAFTRHPWSFGLALKFSPGHSFRASRHSRSAILVLYRRELVPFAERDFWLMEMTQGPLALALEKVTMLKAIGRASKEWRTTFDAISEPLTVIDSSYHIVKANKAFAKLVEQDIKKIKNKRCYSLLANRRSPCVGCPVGMEHQPQAGTRIQFSGKVKKDLLAWSYGIRTGRDSYHFQFYRNVSKETLLASTLIQSEKMAALGRLVGAVAHEINNPLAGILATSQILLSDDQGLDASVRDDMEEIRSAALRSKKIIDDLLGFTATEGANAVNANLLDIISSVLTFSKSALREVNVRVLSADPEPKALVHTNALQQILFNLVTNAAQAMNGKGELLIEVLSEENGSCLRVRDSGPGISPEKLKHIFDPFFTSKQEGSGTGLGLSIVRNLVQKMNAKIEVNSTIGQGTEFTVFLAKKSGRKN